MKVHFLLLGMLGMSALTSPNVVACGLALSVNESSSPMIQSERVILKWDPATKIEEFTREVEFRSNNNRFGFIVPTPTQATAQDVSGNPIEHLETHLAKERATTIRSANRPWSLSPLHNTRHSKPSNVWDEDFSKPLASADGGSSLSPRDILQIQTLAEFTVFTVHTENKLGFQNWLSQNGFGNDPLLQDWYEPYIDRGYYFSVFVYRPSGQSFRTKWVKLSFKSDAPYYPYKEPNRKLSYERDPNRLLRLYLISDRAYRPTSDSIQITDREDSESLHHMRTPSYSQKISKVPFFRPYSDEKQKWIREASIPYSAPASKEKHWLTVFSDWGDYRPAEDLTFGPELKTPSLDVFPRAFYVNPPSDRGSRLQFLGLLVTILVSIARLRIAISRRQWIGAPFWAALACIFTYSTMSEFFLF